MSRRPRSSILMTSAPKSASIRVATEPTPIQQKSATRIPDSGPLRGRGSREGFCRMSNTLFLMRKYDKTPRLLTLFLMRINVICVAIHPGGDVPKEGGADDQPPD